MTASTSSAPEVKTPWLGSVRRRLFGIAERETKLEHRGFTWRDEDARRGLEAVGGAFVFGYHAAMAQGLGVGLTEVLESVDVAHRGFAYEGASMALSLLDGLTLSHPSRMTSFIEGAGAAHAYMVHVGAGWAAARLPGSLSRWLEPLDPLLRWLALDGYGFHQGYFHWPKGAKDAPRRVRAAGAYAMRAYDQGLGRSLWFVAGTESVARIGELIQTFAEPRRSDLWSGLGLAFAYAGLSASGAMDEIRGLAACMLPAFAQGVAFAASARSRAGYVPPHTDDACRILWSMGAEEVAALTESLRSRLTEDADRPAYEMWRVELASAFSAKNGGRT